MITKNQITALLHAWINQRPGIEYGNYGNLPAYRAELRGITHDLHDARELLRAVEMSGIEAPALLDAFRAYSGRLQIAQDGDEYRLDYCAGQYWPTEYRAAACAVLAAALWDYHRPDYDNPGVELRAAFRRMFGKGLASRWFN